MGEVITFTSGKGGVGKTTTTANVGTRLSLSEKKVVLIDTDIGLRNLDVVMGLENRIQYNLVDVLTGRCRVRQALIRDKRYPNLYVIPSSCTKERQTPSMAQMKALLDELRLEFDYILIDSPAGVGLGFLLATFDADRVIVVTTPQVAALHDADRVLELLRENPTQTRQLLVNCFDRQMARSGNLIEIAAIRTLLDVDLIGVVSADRQIIISQNQGIPLSGNHTPAGSCYGRIVRRILGEDLPILEDRSAASRRFSFFHRVTDTSGALTDPRRKEGVRV